MPLQTLQYLHRTAPAPVARLPFSVLCAGHYRVTPPYTCPIRAKPIVQLFWGWRGAGYIVLRNQRFLLKPGNVTVYLPGMRHEWSAAQAPWEFLWMSMDGPLAEPIATAFGLYAQLHQAGPAPRALFRQLIRSLQRPARDSESRAAATAFQIMALAAHRPAASADQLAAGAVELIHQKWRQASFNVKTLAADIRINRSSLSRRFQAAVGVSPTDYIQRLRLQQALALLRNTQRPVSDIAAECGFADTAYFCRWVRRVTGASPLAYRRSSAACLPSAGNRVHRSNHA